MADYSTTPLIKKLGIKATHRLTFINAPPGFRELLGEMPPGVQVLESLKKPLDFVLFFTTSHADLTRRFTKLAAPLAPNGMLWVAYPKKSSGLATDLNFNLVQTIGLEAGLVDTKICAVDETWSGVKFVYRLKDRVRIGNPNNRE
jgi:hypothetical protein